MLDAAARSCVKLENQIEECVMLSTGSCVNAACTKCNAFISRIKRTDATKLQNEYSKLVAGLQDANEGREEDDILANPGMWDSLSASIGN
jgi:hypothetical protein